MSGIWKIFEKSRPFAFQCSNALLRIEQIRSAD